MMGRLFGAKPVPETTATLELALDAAARERETALRSLRTAYADPNASKDMQTSLYTAFIRKKTKAAAMERSLTAVQVGVCLLNSIEFPDRRERVPANMIDFFVPGMRGFCCGEAYPERRGKNAVDGRRRRA